MATASLLYLSPILASEASRIAFTAGAIMPNYWVFYGANVAFDILAVAVSCCLKDNGPLGGYSGFSLLGDLISLILIAGYRDLHDGNSLQLLLQLTHIPAMYSPLNYAFANCRNRDCCDISCCEVAPTSLNLYNRNQHRSSISVATPASSNATSHAVSIIAERSQPVQPQSLSI